MSSGFLTAMSVFVFICAVFMSVLIHEFAHMVVANSYGVKMKGVTLSLIGGVLILESNRTPAWSSIFISIAGPMASFVIALAFLDLSRLPVVQELGLAWALRELATINLLLSFFNLLPVFPMDGGRIVHAFIYAERGRGAADEVVSILSSGLCIAGIIYSILSMNPMLLIICTLIILTTRASMEATKYS